MGVWCPYSSPTESPNVVDCSKHLFGGRPSKGVCSRRCGYYGGGHANQPSVTLPTRDVDPNRSGGCCDPPLKGT